MARRAGRMRDASRRSRDESFTAFMQEAQPSLLRTAYFLTGSGDAARELVQDALVRAYLAWPGIRAETALAYTRRILVNRHVDYARRAYREVISDRVIDRAIDADLSQLDRDVVVRLLAQLPEQQRSVVVLRYCVDLSERQTAQTLGVSVGSVKSAASRGLAAMRFIVNQEEGIVP